MSTKNKAQITSSVRSKANIAAKFSVNDEAPKTLAIVSPIDAP
jgi:hypothetical protein